MPVAFVQNVTVTKSTQDLYEFPTSILPALAAGKIDLNVLGDNDQLIVKTQVKYTADGEYSDADNSEENTFKKSQGILRLTPVREDYGIKYLIRLTSDSESDSVDIPCVVTYEELT